MYITYVCFLFNTRQRMSVHRAHAVGKCAVLCVALEGRDCGWKAAWKTEEAEGMFRKLLRFIFLFFCLPPFSFLFSRRSQVCRGPNLHCVKRRSGDGRHRHQRFWRGWGKVNTTHARQDAVGPTRRTDGISTIGVDVVGSPAVIVRRYRGALRDDTRKRRWSGISECSGWTPPL